MTDSQFLLIDKPVGWTSFDVVAKLRKITGVKKIGHAGTLDPFATGLLIVAIGRNSTRHIDELMGMNKEYLAEFVLGATTPSLDTETEVEVDQNMPDISKEQITQAMSEMTGEIEQIPPMHSAIKIDGKRLYKMARMGEEIERKPRKIRIDAFELINDIQEDHHYLLLTKEGKPISTLPLTKGELEGVNYPLVLNIRIICSSGTYVRALARDLAEKLGTTGYCRNLRRTKIGTFDISNANKIEDINAETWQKLVKNLEK